MCDYISQRSSDPLLLLPLQVTDRQFLASEAWSTSEVLLKDPITSRVSSGVVGVAIASERIPGFNGFLRGLNPTLRPGDQFLQEFWEEEFGCSPSPPPNMTGHLKAPLPPCSGAESLEGVQHPFTDTSQLRVTYNVYLAVYAAANALHSLLSCPGQDSPPGTSNCASPKGINPTEVMKKNQNKTSKCIKNMKYLQIQHCSSCSCCST